MSFEKSLSFIGKNLFFSSSDNLKLYEDLIMVNKSSNAAGMSADYDLEVLQNTQKINQYDLQINDINKKLQYTKLYFKTKVDI